MKNKKTIIIAIILIIIASLGTYYYTIFVPHQKAVADFESAVSLVTDKNKELEIVLSEADELIEKNETPYDDSTLQKLKETTESAKNSLRVIPEMAKNTDEINKQVEQLNEPIDYTSSIESINSASKEYKHSVAQYKQITNPSKDFIEARLKEIGTITDVQSVTEDHDPNRQLNKKGGYTASVYFHDNRITQTLYGSDTVEQGTEGGGNIEVYANVEDAKARNEYLSLFDKATAINPGSHELYGTVIIRTSNYLTASQQKELTQQILQKLIEVR